MKFIECPQGSVEWLAARSGKITASAFADAISTVGGLTEQQAMYVDAVRKGIPEKDAATYAGYKAVPSSDIVRRALAGEDTAQPSDTSKRYAADLAIERISGQPHGEPPKAWVLERGHEMETAARRIYEGRTGAFVTEAGICLTDDEVFGYSTDGLVDDDGLIEIKAPIDSTKILAMWQTGDTSEYDHQMQGGMWITGRKWCDFIMYVPDLAAVGKDLYVKRVFRDDAFIDDMAARLVKFDSMVQLFEGVFRAPQDGDVVDAEYIEPAAAPALAAEAGAADHARVEVAPAQADLLSPDEELALAKALPEGAELSPAAQALLEQEGAARFASTHPAAAAIVTPIDAARPPAPADEAMIRLGQINERLAPIVLTSEGLSRLGFAHVMTDKSAKLYRQSDFLSICAALIRHVNTVAQAKAA
jgi:exodeoxyribonuclease (lambda-induced)